MPSAKSNAFQRTLQITLGLAVLTLIVLAVYLRERHAPVGNTAIIPAGRLEMDFYDWEQRHAAIMAIKNTFNPEVVLVGDSITHLWGGTTTIRSEG